VSAQKYSRNQKKYEVEDGRNIVGE